MRFSLKRDALALAAAFGVASTAWFEPATAEACGGFFCNNSAPVNQAAERIIFARRANGNVTAAIQIQYSGPSESFSWLLPVQGTPTVGVSSNSAFTALQSATNPQYILTTRVEGTCRAEDLDSAPSVYDAGVSFADASSDGGRGEVTVLDHGSVGPYDYVTISVSPTAGDDFEAAEQWLEENGYDVPDLGRDTLTPYLEAGMNLIAFRLTKGNDAGSIRPVILDFGPGSPSIPIRPTAVASNPDMGVMVWVAGETRAVPANYAHLELNDALINWLSPTASYNDVVTQAANEAGGQGFVTEMANALDAASIVYPSFQRDSWDRIKDYDWTDRDSALVLDTVAAFGGLDGMREVLTAHVAPPEGIELATFLSCPSCYLPREAELEGFVAEEYLTAIEEQVIAPLEATAALFDAAPYVTRLYTTMSADEMTVDPIFTFNPDLGDYSNVHNAERVIECSSAVYQSDAPWRVNVPSGRIVRGRGFNWPFATSGEIPANARVIRIGEAGAGSVVADNSGAITDALEENNARPEVQRVEEDDGCSVAFDVRKGWLTLALAGLAMFWMRRRQR